MTQLTWYQKATRLCNKNTPMGTISRVASFMETLVKITEFVRKWEKEGKHSSKTCNSDCERCLMLQELRTIIGLEK